MPTIGLFIDPRKNLGAMTQTQRDELVFKKVNTIIYNTDTSSFEIWSGSAWGPIGGSGGGSSQAVSVVWTKYSDGTILGTRIGKITKVGSQVVLDIPGCGNDNGLGSIVCGADKITSYIDGSSGTDFPVPLAYRSTASIYAPVTVSDNGTLRQAWFVISSAGDVTLVPDLAYSNFVGPLTGDGRIVAVWTV